MEFELRKLKNFESLKPVLEKDGNGYNYTIDIGNGKYDTWFINNEMIEYFGKNLQFKKTMLSFNGEKVWKLKDKHWTFVEDWFESKENKVIDNMFGDLLNGL